ncbi:MAG: DUF4097 family beta strand repeat-containing protein [Firmicutes bacterium]|nr:DUF4097 family beta strand repeat-containing protein [Bacillota bacterium]
MKAKIFIWIFIVIAGVGLILGIVGASLYSFNFSAIGRDFRNEHHYTAQYIDESHQDFEMPNTINLNLSIQNLTVIQGTEFRFDYHKNIHYSTITYNFYENTFDFKMTTRFAFRLFSISPGRFSRATLTIPYSFTGDLNLKVSTGNINVSGLDTNNINIVSRTGNTTVTNTTATSIKITANTGNVTLNNVISHNVSITNRTGNNTVNLVGEMLNYRIELRHRTGNSRINGDRVPSGIQRHGSAGDGSIYITNRTGNNNLNFI